MRHSSTQPPPPGCVMAAGATLAATDEPTTAARNKVARNFFTTDLLGLRRADPSDGKEAARACCSDAVATLKSVLAGLHIESAHSLRTYGRAKRPSLTRGLTGVESCLAPDAVVVAVEVVWVGVGDIPEHAEVAVGDVLAVEVGWRRRDALVGVGGRQRIYDLLSARRLTRYKEGRRTLVARVELEEHVRSA